MALKGCPEEGGTNLSLSASDVELGPMGTDCKGGDSGRKGGSTVDAPAKGGGGSPSLGT